MARRPMSRLIVISNRVPSPRAGRSAAAGGLATALHAALSSYNGIWFGWSGEVTDNSHELRSKVHDGVTYATMDIGQADFEEYYNGFANRTLWPLFHYRIDLAQYERAFDQRYYSVNQFFARKVFPLIRQGDLVWVHDYHLIPCAEQLRLLGVRNRIGFFLHIPWPAREILVTLPKHRQLVRALFAYDVVGFQTRNDLQAFHDYVINETGGEVAPDGTVHCFGRSIVAEAFPIGIDVKGFASLPRQPVARRHARRIKASTLGRRVILGVDRLDYSKGLDRRFLAYERLLETHPEHRGKVLLLQIAATSRGDVDEYRQIRAELDALAGRINGRFAEYDQAPLRYINRSYSHMALAALYRAADVAFITPLRDGMNLVAKEYVACQSHHNPGVLILSRFAGAARELTAALIANPYDQDDMVEVLQRALEMPLEERRERWKALMKSLRKNDVIAWRDSFVKALTRCPQTGNAEVVRPRLDDRVTGSSG
ncbi:MAG: alpha,alpha-trehalose-phosphate synthase (UDP-forming) [Dongiaceae bacterium]